MVWNKESIQKLLKKRSTKFILAGFVLVLIVLFFPMGNTDDQLPVADNQRTNTPIPCHREQTGAINEEFAQKSNIPERTNIAENVEGEQLTVTGTVTDTDCHPVAHALVTFWQTNANGIYDQQGYTLYGQQYTDAEGKYVLQTIMPGPYSNRTPHINVTIQANPQSPTFTTQLFFPDLKSNRADTFYDDALLIKITNTADQITGTYNFIIERP